MGTNQEVTSVTYPWPGSATVKVEIVRNVEEDTAEVVVHAPMHVNKRKELPFCWSCSFTDREILRDKDLVTRMIQWYG